MPKLSVYVPDDLWDRAKSLNSRASTSQLIQQAITLLVETKSPGPAYATGDLSDTELLTSYLKTQYEQQARMLFEQGYRKGVEYLQTGQVPWDALDLLSDIAFHVEEWAERYRTRGKGDRSAGWMGLLSTHLAGHDRTYVQGFSRALRDVWRAVEYGSESDPRVVSPGSSVP